MKRRSLLKWMGATSAIAATGVQANMSPKSNIGTPLSGISSANTVYIHTMDDFPTPVDGVITFQKNTDYIIVGAL